MLRIAETAPVPLAAPLRAAAPQTQRIAIKPERHAVRGVDLGLALLVGAALEIIAFLGFRFVTP